MIAAEDLGRVWSGREGVGGLTFRLARGTVTGLLGPNGAGKTTTLRLLAGTLQPTQGSATIDGYDVVSAAALARSRVGWLPERLPLYPEMTVRGMLGFCAALRGAGSVDAALARVDLVAQADRRVGNLSRGTAQRVGIATAILHDPPVLLLDEPTGGLDPGQRHDLLQLVRELARGGTTVILSTHVLSEVEAVADRVIVLRAGRMIADTTPSDLGGRAVVRVSVRRREGVEALIAALPGVSGVAEGPGGALDVTGDGDLRPALARALVDRDLLELSVPHRLDEAFRALMEAP